MNGFKKLYLEIHNINLFKILFDVLDKNVDDARLIIRNNNKNKIFEITCTNSIRTFFLKGHFNFEFVKNLKLSSSLCPSGTLEILLCVNDIVSVLKSYDKTDNIILLSIEQDDPNYLIIEFKNSDLDSNSDSNSD